MWRGLPFLLLTRHPTSRSRSRSRSRSHNTQRTARTIRPQERHALASLEGADRLRARGLQRALRVVLGDTRNLGLWFVLGAAALWGRERAVQALVLYVVLRASMAFTFAALKSLVA